LAAVDGVHPAPPTKEDLEDFSVPVLRAQLEELVEPGVIASACVERDDMVELLRLALGGGNEECTICCRDDLATWRMPCCGREDSDLK